MLSSWHPAKWGVNKNMFYKNTGETQTVPPLKTKMAMENPPFEDVFPCISYWKTLKNGDFPASYLSSLSTTSKKKRLALS